MKLESTRVPESSLGSLSSCLVDGDPEQRRRARNIRRRAIFLSVLLQTITLTALVVFPLLGKGERLPAKIFYPLPPYRLGSNHPSTGARQQVDHPSTARCYFCKSSITPGKPTASRTEAFDTDPIGPPGIDNNPYGDPNGTRGGITPPNHTPPPPVGDPSVVEESHRVTIGHIDPSRITYRVEPVYPRLGLELRHETRVELHAIISTDGYIQSLQVISGDPLFYQSALNAVGQWRYTPTLLNDHPVEVDTHITVIYSLIR